IVADPSTVRRHLASTHAPEYHKWCAKQGLYLALQQMSRNGSKLRAAADAEVKRLHQQTLEPHLREKPERVIPYSDELWREAALEWLIATDQPVSALNHPKFKTMIDIAARATNGVIIPGMRSTREEIMKLFHEQMDKLRTRLHVSSTSFYLCSGPRQIILQSDAVTGKIHVTCDAWQAGNTDGYFVVTGHWLEETSPGVWVLQEAILGFTRLNNAHQRGSAWPSALQNNQTAQLRGSGEPILPLS
ncbi:hypothetical protein B0H14DRAFT_2383867, partial [Mycena olivaceomarginata]